MSEKKKNLILTPHLFVRHNIPPWVKVDEANHLIWLGERAFRAYNRLDGTFGAWADYESASREFSNYRYKLGL